MTQLSPGFQVLVEARVKLWEYERQVAPSYHISEAELIRGFVDDVTTTVER
jgi:hypothetical protein